MILAVLALLRERDSAKLIAEKLTKEELAVAICGSKE
jgi:hypothetical protein